MAAVVRQHYPDALFHVNYGPKQAADLGNGNHEVYYVGHKQVFLDHISMRCTVDAAASADTARFAYATSGQTMAAAVTAGQYLTDAVSLEGLTADTAYDSEDNESTFNLDSETPIPAGSMIFIVTAGTIAALANWHVTLSLRETAL